MVNDSVFAYFSLGLILLLLHGKVPPPGAYLYSYMNSRIPRVTLYFDRTYGVTCLMYLFVISCMEYPHLLLGMCIQGNFSIHAH